MRTIEKTVYQYEELSDKAKEKARAWYRDGDIFDADCTIEDAVTIAGLLGISIDTRPVGLMSGKTRQEPCIFYSGFSSQGDGACFEGSYRFRENSVDAVQGYCSDPEILRIATGLTEIQSRHGNALVATTKQRGHYYHALSMDIDVEHANEGEISDTDVKALRNLMVDFANWIYHQLEKEYEYSTSDENVADNIIINEYEFTEDGTRYV